MKKANKQLEKAYSIAEKNLFLAMENERKDYEKAVKEDNQAGASTHHYLYVTYVSKLNELRKAKKTIVTWL